VKPPAAEKELKTLKEIQARVKPEQNKVEPLEETTEEEYQGVRIRDDTERGLVQLFFRHMPTDKVRRYLKKHGFTWEPGERCWQCERNENTGYHARKAVDRGEVKR
jgi:hypothetical protein